jgi:hypothetical protein
MNDEYEILMSFGDGKLLVIDKITNEHHIISSEVFYNRKGAI